MLKMVHGVSETLLAHIGDITVSFALLESQVRNLIDMILHGDSSVAQVITAELSFKQLRALAISLYKVQFGEDEDFSELSALMRRADTLEQTRNQIVHSEWEGDEIAQTATRIKTTAKESRGIHFVFEEMNGAALSQIATDLGMLASDIRWFVMYSLRHLSKAPRTPVMSED